MGGYSHGAWWAWLFSSDDELQHLHITSLEFVAFGVNLIMFAERSTDRKAVCGIDALTSVQALNGWAHSEAMQIVQHHVQRLPEFELLRPFLEPQHVYGEANIAADAASRGKGAVLRALGRALGLPFVELTVSHRAKEFVNGVCNDLRAARLRSAVPTHQHAQAITGAGYPSSIAGDGPGFSDLFSVSGASGSSSVTRDLKDVGAHGSITSLFSAVNGSSVGNSQQVRVAKRPKTAGFDSLFDSRTIRALDLQPRSTNGKLPPIPQGHKLLHAIACGATEAPIAPPFSEREVSALSIRPSGAYALGLAAAVEHGLATARPPTTAAKEARAWTLWEGFCRLMRTSPIRDDSAVQLIIDEEERLIACFFVHLIVELKPREKLRRLVKPKTAMDHIYYVKRIMQRKHKRRFDYLSTVKTILERATLDFCLLEGMESLSPKRREAISDNEKRRMLCTPNNTKLSPD